MVTIIATIKPMHLGNIRGGEKLCEIRKTCPKKIPFKVLCCESGSGGKIKAEFIVNSVKYGTPFAYIDEIERACVPMSDVIDYANDNEIYFWNITSMVDYCSAKGYKVRNISEFGLKRAPQSWQYLFKT